MTWDDADWQRQCREGEFKVAGVWVRSRNIAFAKARAVDGET
jgi:hypothetical protein